MDDLKLSPLAVAFSGTSPKKSETAQNCSSFFRSHKVNAQAYL